MTSQEAKRILLLYRPGTADASDPEVAAALAQVPHDSELAAWFARHCAFQAALRKKFREISVPDDLRKRLSAEPKVIRIGPWQSRSAWLAAAAAVLLLLGCLWMLWLQPRTPDRFADFRLRMVNAALRQYRMDIVTNDMSQVRQFMAKRGAPADYTLAKGLERLQLTGGGFLKWRSNPVAMVCFDRGDKEMLYLFVMDGAATKDAPPARPLVTKVNKLTTASWSRDGKTYLLAGPDESEFIQKYLSGG